MGNLLIPGNIFWLTPESFCNESLSQLRGKRVILLQSISSVQRLQLEDWLNELKAICTLTWISNIASNPTYTDVSSILRYCDSIEPEIVLAIGGGSTIDVAKAVVALWYLKKHSTFEDEQVLNSIETREYLNYPATTKIYATPTTAGTGSEVTRWATIWDMKHKVKYSVEASWLYPEHAYIISEYTKHMPKRLALSTGLDALCHATEAYWAKSSNPMVKELSKVAIRLIIDYLPKVLKEESNLYYRKKLCLGSLFAGLAFSNTRTTACHSISYPLTMCFNIEHGFACAVSLSKVMSINLPMIEDADELKDALRVSSPEELQFWIDEVTRGIIDLRLSQFGVTHSDIPQLAELSFTQGRMDNNPVEITTDDMSALLYSLLH